MYNRNSRILKWALLLLVPIVVFAVMWPVARERRQAALNRKFLLYVEQKMDINEMKKFISQGADVNGVLRDKNAVNNGKTALHLVANRGHTEYVMRFLLAQGANINATDDSDWTPLMKAAESGSVSSVKFLIENGADLNLKTKPQTAEDDLVVKKRTALNIAIVAARSNRARIYRIKPQLKETVRILKAAGAKE